MRTHGERNQDSRRSRKSKRDIADGKRGQVSIGLQRAEKRGP